MQSQSALSAILKNQTLDPLLANKEAAAYIGPVA